MRTLLFASACAAALSLQACGGGGSTPTSPGAPSAPTTPGAGITDGCSAIGQDISAATAIVNGTSCSTANSPVVLLNFRARDGLFEGSCTGTVIAPRVVLTAAHCLDGQVASARVWLGSGAEIPAASFEGHSGYNSNNTTFLDVGIVRLEDDLPRTAVPLLLSRDGRPGEEAIVAGWGRDLNSVGATLRAGRTRISAVSPTVLQTEFSSTAAGICAGDSGGPILLSEGGVWSIAGISSAGAVVTCNAGTNYYASIRHESIRSFILERVPNATLR